MIVDSSAIVAIVLGEPEAERLVAAIPRAPIRKMTAVNWLETLMVVEGRRGVESADETLLILQDLGIEAIPCDPKQMIEARAAWQRYGKGRHKASLNLGDCCAYAAAILTNLPLLYKGDDFAHTDVTAAPW